MLTRERNALYCNPAYLRSVQLILGSWNLFGPLTAAERGRIAEAYQSDTPIEPSAVARAIFDARNAAKRHEQ